MTEVVIRHLEQDDYQPIISVVDEWWGGRPTGLIQSPSQATLPGVSAWVEVG